MESPVKRSKESKKSRHVPEMINMEHVNAQLKGKLKMLTTEMKDAVEKMNSMTIEMNSIRNENLLYKDRLAELEQENTLLVSQIEEMANERAERDAIIEEFGTAVEARIVEWKEILDEKDSTIAKLKQNLMYVATDRITNISPDEETHAGIERLIKDIDCRDKIIDELQTKLAEAVVEINESTRLIEKFKPDGKTKDSSKRGSKAQREMDKKVQDASKRISTLETLLERAEKDAKDKSEKLCEVLAILNKYEDENTSLTEAFEEIKKLKEQMEKKNKHVEDLVDVVNRLEVENSQYEEAIIVLRAKLGVAEDEEYPIGDLILQRQQAQEEKLEEMQRSYNELSSENVDLKFQVRKLKIALKETLKNKINKTNGMSSDTENYDSVSLRSESKKEHAEFRQIKENVKLVIEENEALRQGMHEILDCIHNQDGKSIVTIQSQTLENLLDALDARHLAGWYHPAMRLQGRVNYLQGSNAELRAQLQQIRKNQMLQASSQQRPSSVEEGECHLQRHITPDGKTELHITPQHSRNVTPKSMESANADSGRASGKPTEMDELQRIESLDDNDDNDRVDADERSQMGVDTPLDDDGFGKKSEEIYAMAKEIIAQESDFKKLLNEAEKRQKMLENEMATLRKSYASFVAPDVYNELREKYLESSMRVRAAFEDKTLVGDASDDKDINTVKSKAMQDLRDELVSLHKQLSEIMVKSSANNNNVDSKAVLELESKLLALQAENEKLKKGAEIAHEEALIHRAIDSTVLSEFNDLRQRILRYEMDEGSEIKETARLSLELANYKVIEVELREQKRILERDLARLRDELADVRRRKNNDVKDASKSDGKRVDYSDYIEIVDFLQQQYAGSTSLSSWERYEASLNKLNNDRNEVKELIGKINEQNEDLKVEHETLTSRLQIVEQLKDILEQQIGSNDVQDIMQRFTAETRQTFSESKYKMQISQLKEKVERANMNLSDYEAKLAIMELEINKVQKAWRVQKLSGLKRPESFDKSTATDKRTDEKFASKQQSATKVVQTEWMKNSVKIQCELSTELNNDTKLLLDKREVDSSEKDVADESEMDNTLKSEGEVHSKAMQIILLQEQLNKALALASERSDALSKCESHLTECRAKNTALTKLLCERSETATAGTNQADNDVTKVQELEQNGMASQEAMKSTIKSLHKIIAHKEETLSRYQNLLKEDRDKHSEAAARLHEEIKSLRCQLGEKSSRTLTLAKDNALNITNSECPERDLSAGETSERAVVGVKISSSSNNDGSSSSSRVEEMSILREKISRLETELSISGELAERWHRRAEDRLRHMDSMRARLEEQHGEEIESYRVELNKKQQEMQELQRLVSELRRAPTTKNDVLSFMKSLHIKDNRLADEIENELEEHVTSRSQHLSTTYDVMEEPRAHNFEQQQQQQQQQQQAHHHQLENLRRQLQACMERERAFKSEIAELQQKLSRRYMAVKAQEKKASRREMQLEKKVKELEEELHEAREILDRHFLVQQAKRAKTAEDLGLWEKLKKWQQTAERLKEKLKDKTEECQRLQCNYEKLRNLITCMEREKWYLRGKCTRSESIALPSPSAVAAAAAAATTAAWVTSSSSIVTPVDAIHTLHEAGNDALLLVDDLQRECQGLRDRVKELMARELASKESCCHGCSASDEKKRPASVAFEDDDCRISEIRKLRNMQEILEKENLRYEAENFELRLELERANLNLPRYRDKIQHLEKYVELLKTEKSIDLGNACTQLMPKRDGTLRTKAELERTVLTLKKLIEKLQHENKRLRNAVAESAQSCSDLDMATRCNCRYLRDEHEQAMRRIAFLERELELAEKRIILMEENQASIEKSDEDVTSGGGGGGGGGASGCEVEALRQQLARKSELLLKVKDLLAKADVNEKALRHRIQQLEYKQTLAIIPECGSSLGMALS